MTYHDRQMDRAMDRAVERDDHLDERRDRRRPGPPTSRGGHGRGAPPGRVLLLTLSERVSARTGRGYLSGRLGKAGVVASRGEPDKHRNETWDVFVATPELRPGERP